MIALPIALERNYEQLYIMKEGSHSGLVVSCWNKKAKQNKIKIKLFKNIGIIIVYIHTYINYIEEKAKHNEKQ